MSARKRNLFGPADPFQVITRPDARTTQRLASLTASGRLPPSDSQLADGPPDLAFRNVRYPSLRPPPELTAPEPAGAWERPSPASSGPQRLLALQARPAGTGGSRMPALPSRFHWVFPVAFLAVVAAGALWLALGLRVLSW